MTFVLVALVIIAAIAAWCSHHNASAFFPIAQPTDYAGARKCIDAGYAWYAFEAGGVRCFRSEQSRTWNARATVVSWTEGER